MRTKLLTFILVVFHLVSRADEGMWMLPLIDELNIGTMNEMGLELTAEDIYSVNNSSMKDAIVVFNGGCTAEIISEEGLLITNHHCGYDLIQSHSSVQHDYLTDGFWAMTKEDELPNPGIEVKFLISIKDVSIIINDAVKDITDDEERSDIISEISDSLIEDAIKDSHYEAQVKSFYEGNKYYLFVSETYKDVRLVGAPPSSIGKFGYDTDNWMWPRHTGDFSMFRIYMSPDGTPAGFNEENVPYKPKHYFPISLKGYEKGDFTMVLGYPGSTDRYLTSFEVDEVTDIINKNRVEIRTRRQEIMNKYMQVDDKIRIQYASKYSRSTNYWKYSIGQNQGLKRLDVKQKKQNFEKKFQEWAEADETRKEKYGNLLSDIESAIEGRKIYQNSINYLEESMFIAVEILDMAYQTLEFISYMDPDIYDSTDIMGAYNKIQEHAVEFFKNYNAEVDKEITEAMFTLYYMNNPQSALPYFYETISGKYKGNVGKYVDKMFKKSFLIHEEEFYEFLKNPELNALRKDMAFGTMIAVLTKYHEIYEMKRSYDAQLKNARRLFLEALMEMEPDRVFYPDANFTMRLTYGTIQDYEPRDAVYYNYFTTLKGVIEKEDTDNYEFLVDEKLAELYESENWDTYTSTDYMPVCFITNNDITGGNSGSPVINAKGELIGLAFDGNWEAMSGDVTYEPELQRCICVDIRYVLFVIDQFAGASHLIEEMTIVN